MKKNLLKKQIPTLLALLILFVGAGVGILLVGQGTKFLPRAGPEFTPKQIQLSNITDRSFTVSWVTDSATTGYLRYGTSPSLSATATDDRDQLSGQTDNFKTHHVTVRSLTPGTQYYFKIGSGPSSTLFDKEGSPYEVATGTSLGIPPEAETAYGTVFTASQTPAEGAIVYVKLPGAAPLSTLVKSSGSWAVPLSTIRTSALDNYLSYDKQAGTLTIEIVSPFDSQKTTGTTPTAKDQPVPTITLGQNFDFSQETEPTPTPIAQTDPSNQFQTIHDATASAQPSEEVVLHNPKTNGETLNTTLPEITGSAPANTTLEITLESPVTYQDSVVTDASGQFSWTPPENLEPGSHTLTIRYLVDGVEKIFTRTFIVYAQGTSDIPSFTASPSATPVATAQPTATPRPSPTLAPSPTPIPTSTPTPTPTTTPRPAATLTPTASSAAIPVAGTVSPTLILLLLGLGLIAAGAVTLKTPRFH